METMNLIVQAVGSLGFPIVAYFMISRELREERESHKEETRSLADIISRLENSISLLNERLRGGSNDNF